MNVKKILALMLCAMMLLSLAACGAKGNDKQADMSGDSSAMTGEPKTAEEALALHKELLERENAILSENTELWEKVFMAADKGMTMQEDGKNYGEFLLDTIEGSKDQFTEDELKLIIKQSAKVLNVKIEDAGATELARRSRGTPRLANRILKRVRDFAQVKYNGVITETVAHTALDLMDVDTLGLDRVDRNILVTIIEKFGGGPVGLDTLAASIGEDAGTIEDVYEPYLLMKGLIDRTPRGRVATQIAYTHLGL